MKVGVNVINFGPGATPEALGRWAEVAEGLGYQLVMISDHVAVTPDVAERFPAPLYDPFTTLGWIAARTRRVEIGTTVIIVPYRHPLETARMAATLDRLSGGRLIFGVGVGWARREFEALGVPFERRGAIADDYLAAIVALWTQDVASHEGRFARFRDVHTAPRPLQAPHPPIWVGGSSDAALRRAVRFGQGWHPMRVRVDWLRDEGLPRLRAIAEKEGRPVPALCPRIKMAIADRPAPEGERLAGEGTLEQIHADLAALERLGAPYVLLDSYLDPATVRDPERAWRVLETLATRVLDLPRETLR